MTSYTNVFGGDTILPAFAQYQALSLSANTTLSWPIENRSGVNVLAKTLDVTASGAFTITLPDARLGSVGYSTVIYNIGANAVSVNNAVGGALISIPSGGIFLIYLRTNGTQAGTWGSVQLSTGPSAATAASLASLSVINIGGALNQAMPATILTTGYTLQTSDRASALVWNTGNGTVTLPAGASMGSDFFFFVKGGGTGTVTLQPSGGELIDGASSLQIGNTGSTAVFFKSGGWYTLCLVQAPTLSYTRVVVDVAGTGNFTLTPSQFTNDLIEFTGTLTGNREIIFPTTVNQYVLKNSTTGAFSLGARTASQSPAIDMAGGTQYLFVCDGTNMGLVGTQPVLPALAGNALKYLRANASASALEFADAGKTGYTAVNSAVDVTLGTNATLIQGVTMTADSRSVNLPDARQLSAGQLQFVIANEGTRTFGVRAGNPNQFSNSDFASATGWTLGTGWSIGSGLATKTAGVQSDLTQAIATTANVTYTITFTITTVSGGTVTPVFTGGGADVVGTARNAPGTYTENLVSNGNTAVGFRGNSTFAGSIDNVSLTLAVPALLAVVPAGGVAEMYLETNSTAAGQWSVTGTGLSPALTVIDATLPSTLTQAVEVAVRLTDTLSLHFARNASGHPFVFAVDHSTAPATVGTAVLIVASNLTVEHAFRISATKAMFKLEGASSNVFNVTVSGATCTVSTAATAAVFDAATFTGAPLICALGANSDLFVAIDTTGGNTVRAQAVDCSGTNPSAGSSVNISALGSSDVGVSGVYRISDTTALAIYTDNSGAAGSPFSIRAVVLSLSGTTVTVGTSAGLNDVTAQGSMALANCQLSATSYIVGFLDATNSDRSAVHIGVSGTTVTFGTKFAVEVGTFGDNNTYLDGNSNRFQPLLYPLSATTALYYYGDNGAASRHVVLTNSGGTLSAGTILYGISNFAGGGNFPQSVEGFLVYSTATNENSFSAVTISGTSLSVTGTLIRADVMPQGSAAVIFGLSGGVRGMQQGTVGSNSYPYWNLFRFRANAAPQFLGSVALNDRARNTANTPVEVAANKVAITGLAMTGPNATDSYVKVSILEFAA